MSLSSYSIRHVQAMLGSLGRLLRNPFATSLTLLVIGLALALPLALKLFVTNARVATGDFANAVDVSVYLKADVPLAKAEQLAKSARERSGVDEVTVISSEKALEEFRAYSGFGAALEALQDNPLPHVLHVRPAATANAPADLEVLKRYFTAWPEVDIVQVDSEWVNRFNAILNVLRTVLMIAAVFLGAGVLAVIGNTVRLEILNRRTEIEVIKLVGGSNGFVRRPFLYAGIFYGLLGALVAWGIVTVAVVALDAPVATVAQLYGSHFMIQGPGAPDIAALLGIGIALGWLGAWISAAKHLRSIEPRA